MNNPKISYYKKEEESTKTGMGLDPLAVLTLLRKNWYIFLVSVILALIGARMYIRHTMPVYSVSATVLIYEGDERAQLSNDALLQGLGLPMGMRNIDNQIRILRSRKLTERTLQGLPFEIEYYFKTFRNSIPIYPDIPIKVSFDNQIILPRDTEFSITDLGNNIFRLASESPYYNLTLEASFGDTLKMPEGDFRIELRKAEWFNIDKERKLYFVIHSPGRLLNHFNRRLRIEPETRSGTILNISLTGTNRVRDVEFLNNLVREFQLLSLERKNTEAIRRIQFIDDQLVGISDSLSVTESRLQQFRSTHRVMDVSAQGQAIIGQVISLENERARLNLESNYFDYLADYLAKDVTGELPIVPITMGITDPGLTRLVGELAELQGQMSSRGAGQMNPLQNLLNQRIQSTKEALMETLNGLKRANSLARHENQEQINRVNTQASTLPVTERQLLGIERQFRLNDQIYTFLLQTRAEQQMQKASNRADSEVIDPADANYSVLVAPNTRKIYFVGLFSGFGIPFLIIFLVFLFNKKLKEEDISLMTDMPVIGNIPRSSEKMKTVVFDYPNSSFAEAFRLLRSRLQFITKDAKAPVILVSSSMPGDGKTFTAINLASVCSLLGKKTVLVGFDLRKPKIYEDFNLNNEKGVSTWLIGQDKLEDIINKTSYENLSVITAGPVPPNPSELTALGKTNELINILRDKFEYVIIDSSPIGFISDTFHLATMADAFILVVRPGKTLKDIFKVTLQEMSVNGTNNTSLVLNDLKSGHNHYTYGDKFGYTNHKKRVKNPKLSTPNS